MWRGSLRHPRKQQGKWQVSQVHLAHDIANTSIALEQLDRYVSRSRRKSMFEAAQADLQSLYAVVDGQRSEDGVEVADPLLDLAWEDAFAAEDEEFLDLYLDDDGSLGGGEMAEPTAAEERSAQVYRWDKRLSGVTWSPGGAISFVQYDKTLESRLRNKRFMEPIWRAAGWDDTNPVIRHESRLRRDAVRTLGLPVDVQESLDDPWILLDHLAELWGYVVGHTPHADDAAGCAIPTSVDVAWIRRVMPDADTNRSRWPTNPVWRLVQAAPFSDVPSKARRLIRREQHVHAVEQLDAGAYGYLVSRTALLHPHGETFDVSTSLRGLFLALTRIAGQPDKDFGALVRQRRRKRGLSVAPAGKVLPFLPACRDHDPAELAKLDVAAERILQETVHGDELQAARVRLAEWRLHEAFVVLEQAEWRSDTPQQLTRLKTHYQLALTAYETICLQQVE